MKALTRDEILDAVCRYNDWPANHSFPPRRPESTAIKRNRALSWDICFTHFQKSDLDSSSAELDRLHLGYYLASWGMLRGSSFLQQDTTVMHYEETIRVIRDYHKPVESGGLRGFDVDHFADDATVKRFESAWREIHSALGANGRSPSLTLMTKTFAGVWGCIPALDTRARQTLMALRSGTDPKFTESSRCSTQVNLLRRRLSYLKSIYEDNEADFEALRKHVRVADPETGQYTDNSVPKAKLLDMFLFQYRKTTDKQDFDHSDEMMA